MWARIVKALGTPAAGFVAATGSYVDEPMVTYVAAAATCLFAYSAEIEELVRKKTRRQRASEAALLYLMKSAFIIPASNTQSIPSNTPPFRATILWPVGPPWKRRLKPMLRVMHGGQGVVPAESAVQFQRGQAFAGAAWELPGRKFMRDDLPSLPDCGGDRDKWKAEWVKRGVPGDVVEQMGSKSRYIENVRSILCFAVDVHAFVVVVSIDSIFANGFEDQYFNRAGLENAIGLASCLLTEIT